MDIWATFSKMRTGENCTTEIRRSQGPDVLSLTFILQITLRRENKVRTLVLLLRYESSFFNMIVCHKFETTPLRKKCQYSCCRVCLHNEVDCRAMKSSGLLDWSGQKQRVVLPLLKTKIYRIIPHLKHSIIEELIRKKRGRWFILSKL